MQIPLQNNGACETIGKTGITTVTFEAPTALLEKFDEAIKDEHGNNRSAALRALMRQHISEKGRRGRK